VFSQHQLALVGWSVVVSSSKSKNSAAPQSASSTWSIQGHESWICNKNGDSKRLKCGAIQQPNMQEVFIWHSLTLYVFSMLYDVYWILLWLVVSTLWKIWKSVGMIIPNIWKKTTCSKPPTRYIYIYIQNYISNLWKHCKVYQGINHILVLPFILNHPEARGIIGLRHDPNWPYRPEPKSDTKTNTVTSTYPICSMYAIFTYIILHLPQKWPKRR
jgi:hypothetical protein